MDAFSAWLGIGRTDLLEPLLELTFYTQIRIRNNYKLYALMFTLALYKYIYNILHYFFKLHSGLEGLQLHCTNVYRGNVKNVYNYTVQMFTSELLTCVQVQCTKYKCLQVNCTNVYMLTEQMF